MKKEQVYSVKLSPAVCDTGNNVSAIMADCLISEYVTDLSRSRTNELPMEVHNAASSLEIGRVLKQLSTCYKSL